MYANLSTTYSRRYQKEPQLSSTEMCFYALLDIAAHLFRETFSDTSYNGTKIQWDAKFRAQYFIFLENFFKFMSGGVIKAEVSPL